MFQIVALVACVAVASAAVLPAGLSQLSRSQDDAGNYEFKYDISGPYGDANARGESGDAYGNKRGFYTLQEADGRLRRVDYIADASGFRVNVQTNEPGTKPSETASALYSPAGAQYAAAPVIAAPVVAAAPAWAAPVRAAPVFAARASHVAPVVAAAPLVAAGPFSFSHSISHVQPAL
ncbi:Adult-specific rigid cuticular protein 15.7 [Halotydeus destructor]|nr:Adult-specific rigid cuticular protein 15.7 [Halotydeus destructor]